MKLRLIILFVLTFCAKFSFSQTKEIDSLKKLLITTKEDTTKVFTLNALSGKLSFKGDDTNALEYADEALFLAKKLNHKAAIARSYEALSTVYTNTENFPESNKNLYLALKLFEEIKDKRRSADCLVWIGFNFFWQENYEQAFNAYSNALKIYDQIGATKSRGAAHSYIFLAKIYRVQNKYQEALNYNSTGLKISIEEDYRQLAANAYTCIGDVLSVQIPSGQFLNKSSAQSTSLKEALKNYLEALNNFREVNDFGGMADSYQHVSEVNIRLNHFLEAQKYIDSALWIAKQFYIKDNLGKSYLIQSKLDSARRNYKSAYDHYKLYVLYRDSLLHEENIRKAEGYQMQYEFDKKEDSLHQKQVITQTKLDSQKKQKNFYLAGAGMLSLLSIFVFLNFRNQKKINQLAGDAHAKEKAELELQSLRAQLNPHFMFNSLNAIQELILLEQNEKSQSYLARFAKLLRLLLENADKPFIPLQREIDFLQLYLSLENLRIPDLQFSIAVDSNINTEEIQIPNMILQPYIENAIWHGLSHKASDRKLQIRINNENGFTKYEIEDNGVGRKKSEELKSLYRKEHKSKGMELLSKRFKLLAKEYGSDIETNIADVVIDNKIKGTVVTIKVPSQFSSSNKSK